MWACRGHRLTQRRLRVSSKIQFHPQHEKRHLKGPILKSDKDLKEGPPKLLNLEQLTETHLLI